MTRGDTTTTLTRRGFTRAVAHHTHAAQHKFRAEWPTVVLLLLVLLVQARETPAQPWQDGDDAPTESPNDQSGPALSPYYRFQTMPYSPARAPAAGPWFEMWFTRVKSANPTANFTFGILFGAYCPAGASCAPPEHETSQVSGFLSLVYWANAAVTGYWEAIIDGHDLQMLRDGARSENFLWQYEFHNAILKKRLRGTISFDKYVINLANTPLGAEPSTMQFRVNVTGEVSRISIENSKGNFVGPEFSLAAWYANTIASSGDLFSRIGTKKYASGRVQLYQEKFWGKEMPSQWTRVAVTENKFALTIVGGSLPQNYINQNIYFVEYRSPNNLWQFQADGSDVRVAIESVQVDACKGTFHLEVRQNLFEKYIVIDISPGVARYEPVLFRPPMNLGLLEDPILETFSAVARVQLWYFNYLIEDRTYYDTDVQFGGAKCEQFA